MKLKEITDAVATTCNVRPNVVHSVLEESFKHLRAALEKGEKVMIPGFGIFVTREVPGEDGGPAKKTLRFKLRNENEEGEGKEGKNKEARKAKKAAATAAAADGETSSDDE